MCKLFWLKDGIQITEDDLRYNIISENLTSNIATNDFESVKSTLKWNINQWPGKRLDRVVDSANYTCQSTSNTAGIGVTSTTYFRVECIDILISFSIDDAKTELNYACR